MTATPDVTAHGMRKPFDPEAVGSSLEQLAVDVVKGESTDFMSRWFRSKAHDADLVIWTDGEKRIIKHQLCFFGQVVEWNPIHGTRTGLVIEEEVESPAENAKGGSSPDVAETIRFDSETAASVVGQAISVLKFVMSLSEADRSALIFNLRESPKMHKRARDRAMKAWAPKVEEITSTRRPKFWKRLRHWVLGD